MEHELLTNITLCQPSQPNADAVSLEKNREALDGHRRFLKKQKASTRTEDTRISPEKTVNPLCRDPPQPLDSFEAFLKRFENPSIILKKSISKEVCNYSLTIFLLGSLTYG